MTSLQKDGEQILPKLWKKREQSGHCSNSQILPAHTAWNLEPIPLRSNSRLNIKHMEEHRVAVYVYLTIISYLVSLCVLNSQFSCRGFFFISKLLFWLLPLESRCIFYKCYRKTGETRLSNNYKRINNYKVFPKSLYLFITANIQLGFVFNIEVSEISAL